MPSEGADPASPAPAELGRLRWQCRRGMLELDLLLSRFLDTRYPRLPEAQQRAFARLLGVADPLLHDWLLGYQVPGEPEFAALIGLLRETYR